MRIVPGWSEPIRAAKRGTARSAKRSASERGLGCTTGTLVRRVLGNLRPSGSSRTSKVLRNAARRLKLAQLSDGWPIYGTHRLNNHAGLRNGPTVGRLARRIGGRKSPIQYRFHVKLRSKELPRNSRRHLE